MRTLFVNPFSGLAGDMLVGALLDLGADVPAFWQGLDSLPISHEWEISAHPVMKAGIAAKQFVVKTIDAHHKHDHNHGDHSHGHDHGGHDGHAHGHDKHGHSHGRHLAEIEQIIADSALPDRAKTLAVAAFTRLAEAEAKVHGTTPDKVHFHEVGAVDAIVDVCGACLAYVILEIDQTVCSPIALGGGTVHCDHGTMPVPVPAVQNLLVGVPTQTGPVNKELTTPTGAALITAWCQDFSGRVSGVAQATGYGAGTLEFKDHANVVPATIYDSESATDDTATTVTALSCSLDDATGEDVGAVIEFLFEQGALDVTVTPCLMKKGRPGQTIEVLCRPADEIRLSESLIRHSSTFGIRRHTVERTILNRFFNEVDTPFGVIRVKIGVFSGRDEVIQAAPEFEDCLQAARLAGVSPATVRRAALTAWETTKHKET